MTVTEDATVAVEDTENSDQPKKRGRKSGKDRDFTKFRDIHEEIANYVNAHSGLDPVTPNQIKAVLTLRTDYADTPERRAAREERKAKAEAEKQRFAGMSEDQIKAAKASEREMKSAEKLRAKAEEAMKRARELAEAAQGSGEDLAAVVAQNAEKPRRGLRR